MGRTLSDEDLDAIAERVAGLLQRSPTRTLPAGQQLSVSEVAERLGVHPSFVYANAAALGGYKLNESPKSRWRFDPASLPRRDELDAQRGEAPPAGRQRSRLRSTSARPGRRYVPPIPLED